MKQFLITLVVIGLLPAAGAGCRNRDKDPPPVPLEHVGLALATDPDTGTLGVTYVFEFDDYLAGMGFIPAGSSQPFPGETWIDAGVPCFDTSAIPTTATIVSAVLVLDVMIAPGVPVSVRVYDLSVDPRTIDPLAPDPLECEQAYNDACSGSIYGEFPVDSSMSAIEVPLDAQAIADLQSAFGSGIFSVGLRAPGATESNLVDVSFANTAYLKIWYR